MFKIIFKSILSTLCFSPILIGFNLPATADLISDIEQEHQQIKELCAPLKGLDNPLCQLAALHLGANKFANFGQNTASAKSKVVASLGNSCKEIVPEFLKSPGSAKFPVTPLTTEIFRGMYVVSGKVDSQNSYGALLRASYYCYMRNVPKKGIELLGAEILEPGR